jgi:hypothetical protein
MVKRRHRVHLEYFKRPLWEFEEMLGLREERVPLPITVETSIACQKMFGPSSTGGRWRDTA